MPNNPASAANNTHHTQSHIYKSDAEVFEELLGRGKGDPDVYGYPDQPATKYTIVTFDEVPF